ncbi:hypothetical protein POM88_049920 [Heracleum sosnowskyi]|uniref:Uncharacterized protein n=1 Tax=Heracleum sosnowskyi TaxID=360622 RepID=A0AAD8GXU2_9APIA|nr:hypothetical protein POM88_049920 [Heracleum sosnowskyi]
MAVEGMNMKDFERKKTDRGQDLTLPPMDILCSNYVSKLLAFTVKRKLHRLDLATSIICSTTHDSDQKLAALKQLASLIVPDTRLGDHLDSRVLPQLIKFLEYKERKTHPEDLKNRRFQYYSAIVLTNIVSSKKGIEFKDKAISPLVILIDTWHWFVQIQVLCALSNIANVFPDTCEAIIRYGALELLESLLTDEKNHYALKKSGMQLLSALCRMKPHLLSHKRVLRTLEPAIFCESVSVLVPACLSLSNFTNKRFVDIGTGVCKRLLDLLDYKVPEIVLYALRAIGNYVRWCTNDQLQSIFDRGLLLHLSILFYHKYTEARKETCWIISNIAAAANNSQMQSVISFRLILHLVRFIENAEVEVKEVAACAISNAVLGSDKKQFEYLREKCFEPLNIKRYFSDDPRMIAACLQVHDSILYHSNTLESAELPRKMERLSIGAHMTSGTTDTLASNSAKYAQSSKKVTNKKKTKKGKEPGTALSPDSSVGSNVDLDSK